MLSRTPDETKQGLMCLMREEELDDTCGGCAYLDTRGPCADHILPDALALVEQLQATVSEKEKVVAELLKKVEQLQAERDAAICELEVIAKKVAQADAYIDDYIHADVDYSTYLDVRGMVDSIVNWEYEPEWRGARKEDQPNT